VEVPFGSYVRGTWSCSWQNGLMPNSELVVTEKTWQIDWGTGRANGGWGLSRQQLSVVVSDGTVQTQRGTAEGVPSTVRTDGSATPLRFWKVSADNKEQSAFPIPIGYAYFHSDSFMLSTSEFVDNAALNTTSDKTATCTRKK
jgi:hypothetical protein